MTRLPAYIFTFEKSVQALQYSIFWILDLNADGTKIRPEWKVIGWCRSESLPYRASEEGYAVMFEQIKLLEPFDTGEIGQWVWLHMKDGQFKAIV